jgi:hypothetical protein
MCKAQEYDEKVPVPLGTIRLKNLLNYNLHEPTTLYNYRGQLQLKSSNLGNFEGSH